MLTYFSESTIYRKWVQEKMLERENRFKSFNNCLIGKDCNTDTDSINPVNHGPCWDVGNTLGCSKAQGKAETLAPWNPIPWKASPHDDTLKNRQATTPMPPLPSRWPLGCCHAGPPGHHLPTGPPGLHPTASPPATSSKHAWKTFSRPNRILSCWSHT
jgi:hypothetical protein